MIVVVASQVDEAAAALCADFPPGGAGLLTCRDLSTPGWVVEADDVDASVAIVGGRAVAARAIAGVVTMMPGVFERELVHIHPDDRPYVAAEMTAFLVYWLTALRCPRLNPPAANALAGPSWGIERWRELARAAGLAVPAVRRSTRAGAAAAVAEGSGELASVVVVGDRCPDDDGELAAQARALARMADVPLLEVAFRVDGGRASFAGATPFADLGPPARRAAVRAHLAGGAS